MSGEENEENFKAQILDRPEFSPMPPANRAGSTITKRGSRFDKLLDILRQHPGQQALIATYTKGGKVQTRKEVKKDYQALWKYLSRNYPLEKWSVHTRVTPGTWYHRELRACYHGPLSQEQADFAKAQRQEANRHIQVVAARNKARRADQARSRALREQEDMRQEAGATG